MLPSSDEECTSAANFGRIGLNPFINSLAMPSNGNIDRTISCCVKYFAFKIFQ